MLVIKNASILKTITNGDLKSASILIKDGKIRAIGTSIDIPDDAEVIDASNYFVTPGLVDCHTHLGIFTLDYGKADQDQNEVASPVTPEMRSYDGFNTFDSGLRDALQGGVTSCQVLPGSRNVIGGVMFAAKTYGPTKEDMVIKNPSALKIAFGENPKEYHGKKRDEMPTSRMGVAALLRKTFIEGMEYNEKLKEGQKDPSKMPKRDIGMEHIVKVLNKEIMVRSHAHQAEDILNALEIADEFNLNLTIEHTTEGHLIVDKLAQKGVKCAIGPTMTSRNREELRNQNWDTVIKLAEAGINVSLITDHPYFPIQYHHIQAAIAVREGLPIEKGWEAITINPARHIGIEDRVGSLEVGKDADIVLWTDDPLKTYAKVVKTIVNGHVAYDGEK